MLLKDIFYNVLSYLLELEATNPVFFHSFQQWNSFWNKILHKTQIYKGNKPRTWYVLGERWKDKAAENNLEHLPDQTYFAKG